MKIFSKQPIEEFLEGFRDHAIQSKAPPVMIDKIDELLELGSLDRRDEEMEELAGKIDDLKKSKDDLIEALADLLNALDDVAEKCGAGRPAKRPR